MQEKEKNWEMRNKMVTENICNKKVPSVHNVNVYFIIIYIWGVVNTFGVSAFICKSKYVYVWNEEEIITVILHCYNLEDKCIIQQIV